MRKYDGTFAKGHSINKTHGMTKSRVYKIWDGIKRRCLNPKMTGYERYGGAGINLCNRWLRFENFFKDMGNPPSQEYSIDRIDGTKGYTKKNCRWATKIQQQANIKSNVNMTFEGQTFNQSEWVRKTGLHLSTIRTRLRLGWSIEKTLSIPARPKSKN